jgi:hypothetical protein
VYSGVSIALLGVATAIELEGNALVLAYAFEAVVISLVAFGVLRNVLIALSSTVLLAVPAVLSLQSISSSAWDRAVFQQDFFVLVFMALCFFGLGIFYSIVSRGTVNDDIRGGNAALLIVGSLYGYIVLWHSLRSSIEISALTGFSAILVWATVLIVWLIIFGIGAFMLQVFTKNTSAFYVYASLCIVMLGAMTVSELEAQVRVMALVFECTAVTLIAFFVLKNLRIAQGVSALFVVPALLESITSPLWKHSVFHEDFFVLFLMSVSLLGIGTFFALVSTRSGDDDTKAYSGAVLIVGTLYAYGLLWLSLHAWFDSAAVAIMLSLFVYTIIGIVTYYYGLASGQRGVRLYGGVLLGFVVGRLLLIDVWEMILAWRIVTFFVIGTMLIATAFLGRKNRHE